MRLLALLSLALAIACGGRQQHRERVGPEQYHGCGIPSSEENPWPCGAPEGVQESDAGPVLDTAPESDANSEEPIPVVPETETYHGCGFPSTPEVPCPCGKPDGAQGPISPNGPPCGLRSTEVNPDPCGRLGPQPEPEQQPSNNVRDKPGYCGTPGCGVKAKPVEDKGYESEWDRPDYCGTPGCGHDQKSAREKDLGLSDLRRSPLQRLTVRDAVLGGYNRKNWKHWIDADHDCQDTRQEVLIAESQVPVTFKDARNCKVATGQWVCPYTGETFTDPSKLDVDHMVPLGAAHEAGGYAWGSARRQDFANELDAGQHLIAVKASANRSKGKKGPDEWLPANEGYRCQYLRDWISIKVAWRLTVTTNEKRALQKYATRCGRH